MATARSGLTAFLLKRKRDLGQGMAFSAFAGLKENIASAQHGAARAACPLLAEYVSPPSSFAAMPKSGGFSLQFYSIALIALRAKVTRGLNFRRESPVNFRISD